MKDHIKSAVVILIAGFALSAMCADTGTVSQVTTKLGPVIKNTFTWTTGTNNNSVVTTGETALRGEILRVTFDPRTSASPTNAYDVTIKDEEGIDLLAGLGSSLSTNTVTTVRPGIATSVGTVSNIAPYAVNGPVLLSVTNSGHSKSGKIIIYTK